MLERSKSIVDDEGEGEGEGEEEMKKNRVFFFCEVYEC